MSTLTDPLDPDCAPDASDPAVFGGVEAGGTKWVCAKGTGPGDLAEVEVIPTTTPPETLGRVIEFFKRDSVRVAALGVGSFGPVDLRVGSETFGWIKRPRNRVGATPTSSARSSRSSASPLGRHRCERGGARRAALNAVLAVSPERVVLGGGVMKKPGLLSILRTQLKELISDYIELAGEVGRINHF